ncbi:MAG: Asp23/Gls24 family envelope stress response protein [Gracilibacteraceae bacterium]|nr:Asp23/Gls24 family envelope stress response protein [Gracilibacteraceae bacterium]
MGNTIENDLGSINISEEVVANLAGSVAVECYGLIGMSPRKLTDGVVGLLKRENLSRGVEVKIEGGSVVVDLYVVVGYGIKISEVAANVMERVKYTLESSTSLKVAAVNVNVQGVRFLT